MNKKILAVTIAFIVTNIVFIETTNSQDSITKSQILYEAQNAIPTKSNVFIYNHIEKDKISISENTFSE